MLGAQKLESQRTFLEPTQSSAAPIYTHSVYSVGLWPSVPVALETCCMCSRTQWTSHLSPRRTASRRCFGKVLLWLWAPREFSRFEGNFCSLARHVLTTYAESHSYGLFILSHMRLWQRGLALGGAHMHSEFVKLKVYYSTGHGNLRQGEVRQMQGNACRQAGR